MIHELREYSFEPAKWAAYRSLFEALCLPLRGNDHGVLLGSWLAEDGDALRFVHLWRYDSLDARAALRARLAAVPGWSTRFLPQARELVSTQTLSVLLPHGGIEPTLTHEPGTAGDVVYLHRYRCAVGYAGALAHTLAARPAGAARILGLWSTEFPHPNDVALLGTAETPPHAAEANAVHSLRLVELGHAAHMPRALTPAAASPSSA